MENEQHGIIKTYLRYSKRVVLTSMFSWIGIAAAVIGLLYWLSLSDKSLDEYVASTLRTVLSSSSGVAIAGIGSYMIHSSFENFINMKQKIKQLTQDENEEIEGGNG